MESGPRLGGAAALYSAGGVRACAERDRNPLSPLSLPLGSLEYHVARPR